MGYQPNKPELLGYPKFRFFLLTVLGEKEFVRKAKQEIDAINHLREKEYANVKPPKGETGQIGGSHTHSYDPYPERGKKFNDSYLEYILFNEKIIKNKNYIEIDVSHLSEKEAMAAIMHEKIHYLKNENR